MKTFLALVASGLGLVAPLRAQPGITTPPTNQTVRVGEPAFFTVAATGTPPLTYQWRKDGADLAAATNADYSIPQTRVADAGRYTVMVSNATGRVTSDAATLTVHYVVQFSAARFSAWETGRVAVITVRRGDDGPGAVTVNYATSDGTAAAGQDYTATSGTLTFAAGETEKAFTIAILDDALPEGAETLRLSLSGLTGPAVFGAITNAQLTILEDEQSSVSVTRAGPVIAAGMGYTVALKADGSLWAWGLNSWGQLGTGMDLGTSTNSPTRVGTDHDWATVAAGDSHTLAVKADGSLWAWGRNYNGQDFNPVWNRFTNVPVRVGVDSDWLMVAAGDSFSLGLKTDRSLWQWGRFYTNVGIGQFLGDEPARVGADNDWAWVSASGHQVVALKLDGTLWVEGKDVPGGQLWNQGAKSEPSFVGPENDWSFATTGGEAWCVEEGCGSFGGYFALKGDGTLWSWGDNQLGQLGDGTADSRGVAALIGLDGDWATIAASAYHALAVKDDGSLWAWGSNLSGQLGLGLDWFQLTDTNIPTRVGTDNDWVAITAGPHFPDLWGMSFSIGLKRDGSLWSWGRNDFGWLGLGLDQFFGTNVPTRIGTDNDWAQPSAPPVRGEFRITAQSLNVDHTRTLFFTHTNSRAYYVLYRGDALTNITTPADAALPRAYPSLTDRTPPATNATAFYRIRAVPRTQPLDLDRDGIDDYYELRHAAFLHPLNPADAAQDPDGDGYSNLAEYRAGTDPARPTVRHSIASGLAHTVVLKQDGSLWAWGDNTYGQLGDGTYDSRPEPVRIGTDTDWISVAVGRAYGDGDHTVALKRDGSLWAWGANTWGQLGYPPDQIPGTNVPVCVGTSSAWTDVAAGGGFTGALQRNGSLWLWGNNNGDVIPCCNNSWTPICVGKDTDWTTLAAGGTHILALKADRSLWAWGNNDNGQCGLGEGVFAGNTPMRVGTDNDWIAIAASGQSYDSGGHSVGIKADGTLWSWGFDRAGDLGLGRSIFMQFTPSRVGADTDWVATAVAIGTSLARKRDDSIWAWGAGIDAVPTLASPRRDWKDFAAGGAPDSGRYPNFATADAADGSLWKWPFAYLVQVPVQIGSTTNWAAVTAGGGHSLALKLDGSLWCWGWNDYGQLGDGTFTSGPIPRRIASDTTWKAVSAGYAHTVAIRQDRTLWAWGFNQNGQLGIGTFNTNVPYGINIPQLVGTSTNWESIAAGGGHNVALRMDGSLWTWGADWSGQLGNGLFTTNSPFGIPIPILVEPAETWSAMAAGNGHTIGLRSDGSLWACGYNHYGQLGLGLFTTNPPNGFSTLRHVLTNVMWKSISAGLDHTLSLDTNGNLWAWGQNNYGQLGNSSSDAASFPQPIALDKTWSAIAAGSSHTLALNSDGTLWTWGNNTSGQLGIGTVDFAKNTPQPVQPNTTWKAIAAGWEHTLAIREDGTLWSWGLNVSGQLGITPDLTPRASAPPPTGVRRRDHVIQT